LPSPSPESPLRYRTPMIFLRLALLPKGRIFPFEHKLRGIRCCAVSDSSVLLLCTSGDEAKPLPSKRFWLQKIAKHLYSLEQISAASKTKPSTFLLSFHHTMTHFTLETLVPKYSSLESVSTLTKHKNSILSKNEFKIFLFCIIYYNIVI